MQMKVFVLAFGCVKSLFLVFMALDIKKTTQSSASLLHALHRRYDKAKVMMFLHTDKELGLLTPWTG